MSSLTWELSRQTTDADRQNTLGERLTSDAYASEVIRRYF